jgi:hypothetical protein
MISYIQTGLVFFKNWIWGIFLNYWFGYPHIVVACGELYVMTVMSMAVFSNCLMLTLNF